MKWKEGKCPKCGEDSLIFVCTMIIGQPLSLYRKLPNTIKLTSKKCPISPLVLWDKAKFQCTNNKCAAHWNTEFDLIGDIIKLENEKTTK